MLAGYKTYIFAVIGGVPALIDLIQVLTAGGDFTTKWGAITTFFAAIGVIWARSVAKPVDSA